MGSKPTLDEQTVHGEKWTWTPGCKGCMWSRRGYHHTMACSERKQAFLVARARAQELRIPGSEAWKEPSSAAPSRPKPSSAARHSSSAREEGVQPEPVDEQPQPDVDDTDMTAGTETPDAGTTPRTRISAKRSEPVVPNEEVPKRLRIWTKTFAPVDARNRVRSAGETCTTL